MAKLIKAGAVTAKAVINKKGGAEMKILRNSITIGKEVEATSKDGSRKYYYRPVSLNGEELKTYRLYRTTEKKARNGVNVEILKGWFPLKDKKGYENKFSVGDIQKGDIIQKVNQKGETYETVEVENQPTGVQVGAWPSKINTTEVRVVLRVYPDFKD